MSTTRAMPGGAAVPRELPRGVSGRPLCRWCSLEVPAKRRTFCSDYCVHEWRLRSNPGYLRQQVFHRDKGVCASCGVNTVAAQRRLKKARGKARAEMVKMWGLSALRRKSLWDADHILPVVMGGGECDLANMQTLCLNCHRRATSALRAWLRKSKE